ncbi:alpha/beta hydrolase [Actinoplanes sp. NPDC049596]|uniref:alpha/beta fold hydrolase n=1 Tax=unclassified Actinoplanes TaxID=2626549 RepID=UPI00341F72D1
MPDPIVLVHEDTATWDEQRRVLTAAGHPVVSFADFLRKPSLTGCVLVAAGAGTGPAVRHLSAGRSGRVRKAVLIGVVPPFLPRTEDNPDGLDDTALAHACAQLAGDPALADQVVRTDYRADLPRIAVPVLVLHGDADTVLPIDATAHRLPGLIPDLRYEVIPDGPHDLGRTHPSVVNRYLLDWVAS